MPETDTIPVSASVASIGPGIRYIGDYAYAYSGQVTSSGSDMVTLLEFTTGAGLIDFRWEFDYDSNSGNNAVYQLLLNDITVASIFVNGGVSTPSDERQHQIIVPPLTKVLFQAKNHTGVDTIFFMVECLAGCTVINDPISRHWL